jgi:uncharacterized protein
MKHERASLLKVIIILSVFYSLLLEGDLTEGQKHEIAIGSSIFEESYCKNGHKNITRQRTRFCKHTRCSKCRLYSSKVATYTLIPATYESRGKERVIYTCTYPHCKHIYETTQETPKKSRSSDNDSSSSDSWGSSGGSSSSSSSSYGGGSSSGGGGSGSW